MPQVLSGFLAGLACALAVYAAIALVVAHHFTSASRVRPAHDEWRHFEPQAVRLTPRGEPLLLAGWYFASRRRERAVVLVHGKDSCRGRELRASTLDLVDRLHSRGFSVLMIDLRGHGESAQARMTYGLAERRDVLGAVDWLLARGYLAGRVGVLGASLGGASAIGAAAEEPAIGALVTDSAFADFHEMIDLRFRELSRLPAIFLPGSHALARLLTGHDLRNAKPERDAGRIGARPMLVIHASQDPFVPVEHARRLAAVSGARLWVTDGQRHLASFARHRTEYVEQIIEFFDRHLSKP
jgi:pimeloyl-ACP methyl ester carboxylesterase